MAELTGNRTALAWLVLVAAMCVSATWMMIAGQGLTLTNDDLFYYAQYIVYGASDIQPSSGGLEYFLAPSNGHLQVGGKLLYRGVFETIGADYTVLRALNVAGLMVCVGLFFELARRRIGPWAALVPCLSLLFLGYAWEAFIWAFDLHTTYSLAFGLAAILALRREDRRGDVAACVLLFLSIAMIELGLAVAIGIAVSVLLRPDRWRRTWIFLIPIALYCGWWLWAAKFNYPTIEWANVELIPRTVTDALAAIAGSVFGLNPTGEGVSEPLTGVTGWGSALAALAAVALIWRISRGGVPRTLWVFLAIVLAYWVLIALGGRAPDSSRYIFAGTLLVFLVAADALAGARLPTVAVLAALGVVALAIPPNVAKLYDGRGPQLGDSINSRLEYAMLDLVEGPISPQYAPGKDKRVTDRGGIVFTPMPAGDYLEAAERFGSLGMPLDELRGESQQRREVADASLVGALRLELEPAAPPVDPAACPSSLGRTARLPRRAPDRGCGWALRRGQRGGRGGRARGRRVGRALVASRRRSRPLVVRRRWPDLRLPAWHGRLGLSQRGKQTRIGASISACHGSGAASAGISRLRHAPAGTSSSEPLSTEAKRRRPTVTGCSPAGLNRVFPGSRAKLAEAEPGAGNTTSQRSASLGRRIASG
jgi:hypothetical protein